MRKILLHFFLLAGLIPSFLGNTHSVFGQEMSKEEDPMGSAIVILNDSLTETKEELLPLPSPGFEESADGWITHGFRRLPTAAREGQFGMLSQGQKIANLRAENLPVRESKPHRLFLWVRSETPMKVSLAFPDARSRWGRNEWSTIPSTQGRWQSFSHYFRAPEGASVCTLQIQGEATEDAETAVFAIDEIRLGVVTENAFSEAYDLWRSRFPQRDISPRPQNGQNLALSLSKLRDRIDPERPFLIWAIGSSYTNMLGMGETFRQVIRQRFANPPEILYRKHVGSAVTWNYIAGWYRHQVNADQPDLILIYAIGKASDLDQLLEEIRSTSTADIIVPSIHWRMRDSSLWGKSENARDQTIEEIREVCRKHNVQFVENRKEWAEYMQERGYALEIDPARGLLKDDVHQSDYGALVINENISRHFNPEAASTDKTNPPERRVPMSQSPSVGVDTLTLNGNWILNQSTALVSSGIASAHLQFTGNRVDLIGRRTGTEGGLVKILLDGKPAEQADAFVLSEIKIGDQNSPPYNRGLASDYGPHGILLGRNPIPQKWTISMIDDEGNYTLKGSATGDDGHGNVLVDFVSQSQQIKIPASLWRRAVVDRGAEKGRFSNRKGDSFTFDVSRSALSEVSFAGKEGERFRVTLALNLSNEEHTLEAIFNDNGPVSIEAFDVFEPPLRKSLRRF